MAYVEDQEKFRKKAKLSKSKLARAAEVDRATVVRSENKYNIRDENAQAILDALNSTEKYKESPIPDTKIIDGGKTGEFPPKDKRASAKKSQVK